jgi:alpha-glucoside transport system ATP-binding protein
LPATSKDEIDPERVRAAPRSCSSRTISTGCPRPSPAASASASPSAAPSCRDPKVFLFDEPLSNLDAALRVATRIEIAKLKNQMPETTMIYVTHDQVEAMTLADRIVVLATSCGSPPTRPSCICSTPPETPTAAERTRPQ